MHKVLLDIPDTRVVAIQEYMVYVQFHPADSHRVEFRIAFDIHSNLPSHPTDVIHIFSVEYLDFHTSP